MKTKPITLAFSGILVTLVLFVVVIPFSMAAAPNSCNSQGFVINGADANWCESTSSTPNEFDSLLEAVMDRVAADYARAILRLSLPAVPDALSSRLAQVTARVGFDFARANKRMPMFYPLEVVNDHTSPVLVGGIAVTATGDTTAKIQWTTNEFANSKVRYGTTPGSYPKTVSNNLYVTNHSITLTGLTPGVPYYYRVNSVDLSDNTYQSSERTFIIEEETYVFLPTVIR